MPGTIRLTVSLPADLWHLLEQEAAVHDKKIGPYARALLIDHLKQARPTTDPPADAGPVSDALWAKAGIWMAANPDLMNAYDGPSPRTRRSIVDYIRRVNGQRNGLG